MHFHFRHGACQLDPGRPPADNDKIEKGLQLIGAGPDRVLKGLQDTVAQGHRVGHGFHRKGMGLDPAVAKKIGGAAKRNDEPVVCKIFDTRMDDLFTGIDALHFGDMNIHIFCVLKYFPQRKGDAGRFEPGRGNLVHERLKLVIVVAIDEEHLIVRVIKLAGDPQSCKTGAENDDAFLIVATYCHRVMF